MTEGFKTVTETVTELGDRAAADIETQAEIGQEAAENQVQEAMEMGYTLAATNFDTAFPYFTALKDRLERNMSGDFQINGQRPEDMFAQAANCCTVCSVLFNKDHTTDFKEGLIQDFQQEIIESSPKGKHINVARPLIPLVDRYIQASWKNKTLTPEQDAYNREAVGLLFSLALQDRRSYFSRKINQSLDILPQFTTQLVHRAVKDNKGPWIDLWTEQKLEEAAVMTLWFSEKECIARPSKQQLHFMTDDLHAVHNAFDENGLYADPLAISWGLLMEAAKGHYPKEVKKIANGTLPNATGKLKEQAALFLG
ncbi:MAG: hypothetical protein AB7S81_06760 [Bdellovibrionales bacterium]